MFEECGTLAELNAARIKAASEGVDLITINNEYNCKRQAILNGKKKFKEIYPIKVKPREVTQYCGVPIAGRAEVPGCIVMTENGFLY